MTLRHLKIFAMVCETGSTVAAAEKLYIAQPSISLAIKELEEYYGIQLFDRIAKRLYITEAGKNFLQYAEHIVRLFDNMEKEVKNFDTMGVLRVGSSVTIGNCLLPQYVAAFKKQRPKMEVHVMLANADTIEKSILENRIDLALTEGMVHSPYLIEHAFRDDELVLVCAREHSFAGRDDVRASEMKSVPLILREPGSAGREFFDSVMLSQGVEVVPAWESISTQAIIRAVQANLGVSVLPYLLVKDSLTESRISQFRLQEISFKRKFRIVYHKNKFLTRSAQDFIALCK